MARAFPQTSPQDYGRDRGGEEWQSLRGELVSLLEQVESQVARSGRDDAGASISERMRALQAQLNDEPPVRRHQEALRSVQRAVDRFSDRDEGDYSPASPRDSIQSAISQIRSRQGDAAPRSIDAPRADQMAQAVESLGRRLEGLESEIRTQLRSSADIKGVADQVSQLAHVVELLAGAVGETGQVKRLEGQLAAVAKLIAQGREADVSVLTRRLDDVSATVGRLADLQVQYAGKVENPAQSAAFKDGMQAIEASVRNVYDRIDTLERSSSISPDQLDNMLAEMARFTEAMKDAGTGASPQNLVELIDALNSRISEMETGDHLLNGLRKDLTALREAVVVSLEPRFAAIERKIDYLGGKYDLAGLTAQVEAIGARIAEQPIDSGIGHVEAQVRQLVARMDQTGEQLAGLAKLYAAGTVDAAPDIDVNAIADAVAARTSEAVAQSLPPAPSADLTGVRDIIGEVNLRLARLETALLERRAQSSEPDEALRAGIADIIEQAESGAADMPVVAPPFDAVEAVPAPTGRDAMPMSPVVDVPLNSPPFPDPQPVRSALETKQSRKKHPGLERGQGLAERYAEPAPLPPKPEPIGFDVEDAAVQPPAPRPNLGIFEPAPMPATALQTPVAASSRNTFIEAARRAAQRQSPHKAADANPNSLIGRALSRFQTNAKPAGDEPARALAGDKPARTQWTPEPVIAEPLPEPDPVTVSEPVELEAEPEAHGEPKGSFIGRNRKVILLGAVLVVMVLLAANLVLQRVGGGKAPAAKAPAAEATDTVKTGSIGDTPTTDELADEMPAPVTAGPRVVLPAQGLTTGSIGPNATQGFAAEQPMPEAVSAAGDLGATDSAGLEPVKFELPPDSVGPLELRQAAANGDMRAQFEIAAIYTEGRAVPLDYAAAAVWYERAGLQGFAPAEYRLGSLYENGQGLAKDLDAAKLWYGRAAASGNRMSMHNLAALYAGGQLGTQDFAEAAKWFEQAASRGLTDSQFNLGMLYARGLGVKQDLEMSYKWFGIAALSGDKDAIAARDDIARSLDADAVSRLNAVVAAWAPAPVDLAANFAPIGTWMDKFDPGETIDNRDIVLSVQKALSKLGFDVGTPDGLTGPKTAVAIKAFEHATGMSEIGLINPRLLAVLGSQPV